MPWNSNLWGVSILEEDEKKNVLRDCRYRQRNRAIFLMRAVCCRQRLLLVIWKILETFLWIQEKFGTRCLLIFEYYYNWQGRIDEISQGRLVNKQWAVNTQAVIWNMTSWIPIDNEVAQCSLICRTLMRRWKILYGEMFYLAWATWWGSIVWLW